MQQGPVGDGAGFAPPAWGTLACGWVAPEAPGPSIRGLSGNSVWPTSPPLIPTPWDGLALLAAPAAMHRGPIQEPGPGFQGGWVLGRLQMKCFPNSFPSICR